MMMPLVVIECTLLSPAHYVSLSLSPSNQLALMHFLRSALSRQAYETTSMRLIITREEEAD